MQLRTPPSVALAEHPAAGPAAAMRACLALAAGIGGALTMILLALSMAVSTGDEAGRIADGRRDDYAAALVSALAVNLSKPLR